MSFRTRINYIVDDDSPFSVLEHINKTEVVLFSEGDLLLGPKSFTPIYTGFRYSCTEPIVLVSCRDDVILANQVQKNEDGRMTELILWFLNPHEEVVAVEEGTVPVRITPLEGGIFNMRRLG